MSKITFRLIKGKLNNPLLKSFGVLLSGTLLAQGIGYAIAPILTRLYSPAEFGELALFMRVTGFISAVATLRYELAIPLPKEDKDAYLLYRVAYRIGFFVVVFITLLFAGLVLLNITEGFNTTYLLLVLIASIAIVAINLGTNWAIRTGEFAQISRQKVVNSIFGNTLKWGFSFFSWGYMGLILASTIGYVFSSWEFLKNFISNGKKFKNSENQSTKKILKEYKDFPRMNLPHVMVDHGRDMLVAMLIFFYFTDSIYGSYSHSYAMLRIPVMLVGVALGQIFYNQVSKKYNENKSIGPFMKKTIGTLLLLSIIPFSILFFYGQEIFVFVFGSNWADSGRFSEIMAFWLMVNFLVSPISALPLVLKKQSIALLLGIGGMLIQVIPLWIIPELNGKNLNDFEFSLEIISYGQAIWLLFTLFIYFMFVRRYDFALNSSSNEI